MEVVKYRFGIAGLVALGLHGLVLGWPMSEEARRQPDLGLERIEVSLGSTQAVQPVQETQEVKKTIPPPIQPHIQPPQPAPPKPPLAKPQPSTGLVSKPVTVEPVEPAPAVTIPQRPVALAPDGSDKPRSALVTAPPIHKAVPLYRVNPPPKYPRLARRRGLEGSVVLDVLVNVTGRAEDVRLAHSSGHGILDKAALKAVQKWQFNVGTIAGVATSMWVKVPVRFRLQ